MTQLNAIIVVILIYVTSTSSFITPPTSLLPSEPISVTTPTALAARGGFLQKLKLGLIKSQVGPYDQVRAKDDFDAIQNSSGVNMLTFKGCPFCIKAR